MECLKNLIKIICILSVVFCGLAACQMAPKRYDKESEGHWQARVLVRDKEASRSQVVNLDLNAQLHERLRMDITAAMGHHVASFVMSPEEVRYLVVRDRKFYEGPASPQALRPILAIPIDPSLLHNIAFDLPIENKDWTCARDEKGYLASCRNLRDNLEVRWSDRKGQRKTVFIDHPSASLQMNFTHFSPCLDERAGLFELEPPRGFKRVRIQ